MSDCSFWISTEVVTALFGCPHDWCHVKTQPSRRTFCVLCTVYNHVPVYRLLYSKPHPCLTITYHLHFWQNDWGRLCSTVVADTGGTDTVKRFSSESWPWRRKFLSRSCREMNPKSFDHESVILPLIYPRYFGCPALFRLHAASDQQESQKEDNGATVLFLICFYIRQDKTNNVHLSCAHRLPERSRDAY